MDWFYDLLSNSILITAVTSWAIAQVAKIFIHWWVYKKFDIMRLFGDGGMPSGHSATVASMATMSAYLYGLGSFEFAVTTMIAIIVCHDAMGVRLETGKQAVVLNEIIQSLDLIFTDEVAEIKLKEFVGHTLYQVLAGVTVGILNATVMYWFVFN